MKVLLVGQNYASVVNSLTIGFDQIEGVKARAISLDRFTSNYNNYSNYFYKTIGSNKGRIPYYASKVLGLLLFTYLLFWCDVVHVYFIASDTEARNFEQRLIDMLCKRKVVTFMGSEVRVPERASEANLYYAEAYNNPLYEYKTESKEGSLKLQKKYSDANYQLVIWDIEQYIDHSLFTDIKIVPHASVNTLNRNVHPQNSKMLIVHSPSAPIAKGSRMINEAMKLITNQYPHVEYKVLSGISNAQYQEYLMNCTILIDQMVWGGYGVSSQQAMEMGKVVLTYINDDRKKLYGKDCPVIHVTKETLFNEVEKLILNTNVIQTIQEQSVRYYNVTHHPQKVAAKMQEAYLSFFYGN